MYYVPESRSDKRFVVKYRQKGTKYEVFNARCLKYILLVYQKKCMD